MVPALNPEGNLPAGIHQATWAELSAAFGIGPHRERLLRGLRAAALALKAAGCSTLYVDGSFVSTKDQPNDYDGCWDPAGVDPTKLDPVLLDFNNGRLAQKLKYAGELFPSTAKAEALPPHRAFVDFFQNDKGTGQPKGILALDLRRLP